MIGYVHQLKKIKWINKTIKFLAGLDKKNFYFFLVTNQSGIGRGFFSEEYFLRLHKKIKIILIKKNVFIDDIKYCPHHPTHGIGKYKKNCLCRKPKNKMIMELIEKWHINKSKSIMIGDQKTDYIASKKSNIKFYFMSTNTILKLKKLFYSN